MILDISNNCALSSKDSKLLDKLAKKVSFEYTELITEFIQLNNLIGLDLILSVCSRNPFHSNLFNFLCKINLLEQKLVAKDKIETIIVENLFQKQVVVKIIERFQLKKISIKVKKPYHRLTRFMLISVKLLSALHRILINLIWLFFFDSPRRYKHLNNIILVDTFILPNSISKNGVFVDRYFPRLINLLKNNVKKRVYFNPIFHNQGGLLSFLRVARSAKKTNSNFIFQESWLHFGDYFFALYQNFKAANKPNSFPKYHDLDLKNIFIDELKKDLFSPSLMIAYCKFLFLKKIKDRNVHITTAIDWYENQPVDKTFNYGMKLLYPNTKVYGYQGYISPEYEMHKTPSKIEIDNLLCPDEIKVISNRSVQYLKENAPYIKSSIVTALRFDYLSGLIGKLPNSSDKYIFISLPMDLSESADILKKCLNISQKLLQNYELKVKIHPANNIKKFKRKVPDINNKIFSIVDKSIEKLLFNANLVISSASSVCFEAASLGIPVAVNGNSHGVSMSPIEPDINGFKQNIFHSSNDLNQFIEKYIGIRREDSIRENFCLDQGSSFANIINEVKD